MADHRNKSQFLIRAALGVIFAAHGMQKVFGAFGGPGLSGFADYMEGMVGVMPTVTAYAVAFGELLAGVALLFGCFHRIAAVIVIVVMLGAVWHVHWHDGFFFQDGGFEYNLALICMALAVFLGGPGAFAYKIEFKKEKG